MHELHIFEPGDPSPLTIIVADTVGDALSRAAVLRELGYRMVIR